MKLLNPLTIAAGLAGDAMPYSVGHLPSPHPKDMLDRRGRMPRRNVGRTCWAERGPVKTRVLVGRGGVSVRGHRRQIDKQRRLAPQCGEPITRSERRR